MQQSVSCMALARDMRDHSVGWDDKNIEYLDEVGMYVNCTTDALCSDAEAIIGCRIHEQHRSPYVTALLSHPVPSYGCVSRELVPTTQQQVDVLLFNATSSQTTSGVNRPHTWATSGHLRQHVYVTLKQSVSYGVLSLVCMYSSCRFLTELIYIILLHVAS